MLVYLNRERNNNNNNTGNSNNNINNNNGGSNNQLELFGRRKGNITDYLVKSCNKKIYTEMQTYCNGYNYYKPYNRIC